MVSQSEKTAGVGLPELQAQLAALTATVTALQATVAGLATTVATFQEQITASMSRLAKIEAWLARASTSPGVGGFKP